MQAVRGPVSTAPQILPSKQSASRTRLQVCSLMVLRVATSHHICHLPCGLVWHAWHWTGSRPSTVAMLEGMPGAAGLALQLYHVQRRLPTSGLRQGPDQSRRQDQHICQVAHRQAPQQAQRARSHYNLCNLTTASGAADAAGVQ